VTFAVNNASIWYSARLKLDVGLPLNEVQSTKLPLEMFFVMQTVFFGFGFLDK